MCGEKLPKQKASRPGAARYLHITLGFSERYTDADECGPGEINIARLHAAAEAYRELLMAAYSRDEYCWYAEAHIPRVTHDIHAGTGDCRTSTSSCRWSNSWMVAT